MLNSATKPAIASKKITRSTSRAAGPSSSGFGSKRKLAKNSGEPFRRTQPAVKSPCGRSHRQVRTRESI